MPHVPSSQQELDLQMLLREGRGSVDEVGGLENMHVQEMFATVSCFYLLLFLSLPPHHLLFSPLLSSPFPHGACTLRTSR